MKDYMKEYEAHLNKITEGVLDDKEVSEADYETGSTGRKLAQYGRILMDQAVTQKDDALSNVMAKVGDSLTRYGTAFGPKSLEELVKKTSTSPNIIKKLLAFAEKIAATQTSLDTDNSDGGLDDEGDNEFTSASDDEMAAMADKAATRARR
jgi:hypothetical protein